MYSQHNVYSHNNILLPFLKKMLSNVYSQHNVYSHNVFLLIQGKVRLYEQFHVYYSNYMNDESNDQIIKRLKTSVKANMFSNLCYLNTKLTKMRI